MYKPGSFDAYFSTSLFDFSANYQKWLPIGKLVAALSREINFAGKLLPGSKNPHYFTFLCFSG
jgi:hypothetical protein